MPLNEILRTYINNSHFLTYKRAEEISKEVDEPSFISSFIENHRMLQDMLNGAQLDRHFIIDAIYTHQSPKVKPSDCDKSVEIADLLIINIHHNTPNIPPLGNAMLFQAKRNSHARTGSLAHDTEAIQFYLYNKWPKFKFSTRKNEFEESVTQWDFSKTNSREHSKYILIYRGEAFINKTLSPTPEFSKSDFDNLCAWNTAKCEDEEVSATDGLICNEDFSSTLSSIIDTSTGRYFNTGNNSSNDHWSLFIHAMLGLAVDKSYRYNLSRQDRTKRPRGVEIYNSFNRNILSLAFQHEVMNCIPGAHNEFRITNSLLHSFSGNTPPPHSDGEYEFELPPSHPSIMIINSFNKEIFSLNHY
ncbi:hypothetical protein REJ49_001899 [Citrobacter farmeri]|nr:hypothetical protein [Citrobacter farmeri]